MTADEKTLVKQSFAHVAPIAEIAADLFYKRLFQLDPSLKPMFKGELKEQGRKLMQMLAFAVAGLERPEELLPALRGLGHRHAAYGVTGRHYDTVAIALLWTLEAGLGPKFTADVERAWLSAYTLIAGEMQAGAQAAAA